MISSDEVLSCLLEFLGAKTLGQARDRLGAYDYDEWFDPDRKMKKPEDIWPEREARTIFVLGNMGSSEFTLYCPSRVSLGACKVGDIIASYEPDGTPTDIGGGCQFGALYTEPHEYAPRRYQSTILPLCELFEFILDNKSTEG